MERTDNGDLCNLYASPSIMKDIKSRMRWAGHVAHGRDEKEYILVRRLEEKRPLARPRSRCKDNIKMDFREIG